MFETGLQILASVSLVLGVFSVIISLLVLRKVLNISRQTQRLYRSLPLLRLETQRSEVMDSVSMAESSVKSMKIDAKKLASGASKNFADIASLLSRTHQFEGNPRPKLTNEDIRHINERLLAIGEGSLSTTRIAEKLGEDAEEFEKRLDDAKRKIDPEKEKHQD